MICEEKECQEEGKREAERKKERKKAPHDNEEVIWILCWTKQHCCMNVFKLTNI